MNLVLGESIGFVSGVYLVVLIPWTILYTVDFISAKWESIGSTMVNGWIHLVIITIPISSIIAYVVLQTQLPQPDYKEMYTAITALILSAYHLARTVWGLRQLHYFREWAAAVETILESASYNCDIESREQKNKVFSFLSPRLRKIETLLQPTLSRIVRLFFPDAHIVTVCQCNSCSHSRRIRNNVNRLLVNNSLIDNDFFAGIAPHVKPRHLLKPLSMKPSRPFVTFTRWATALVAQLGRAWLEDTRVKENKGDPWLEKRRKFAMQVLTTAMLHMDPEEEHGYKYPENTRFLSSDSESVLPPLIWKKITRRMHNGGHVFSHKEVLTTFFKDGRGLPFSFPALEQNQEVGSHRFLWPDLKEAKSALPSRMQETLENFEREHLELFSIFLWIQKYAPERHKPLDGIIATGPESSYRLLQRQLGLDEDDRALDDLPYSFCMHGRSRHLWFNRSILEVSCRIDNWLALCNGEQVKYKLRQMAAIKKEAKSAGIHTNLYDIARRVRIPSDSSEREPMHWESGRDQADQSMRKTMFRKNEEVEAKSLRFQLANKDTRHSHAEQSLTFMGCVMESLRSGLAENSFAITHAPMGEDESNVNWKVSIPSDRIKLPISRQLRECLLSPKDAEHKHPHSAIQERLLWECQVGTHHVYQEALTQPNAHHQLSSMILFILGFPSIFVRRQKDDYMSGLGKCVSIRIEVAMAPQPIYICVSVPLKSADPLIILNIRPIPHVWHASEGMPLFDWDAWRCAFEGRLTARASWQESHRMISVPYERAQNNSDLWKPVKPLETTISNGKRSRLFVWDGWKPFREGMAIFELKYWFYAGSKENAKPITSAASLVEIANEKVTSVKEKMRIGGQEYGLCSTAVLNNGMSLIDTVLGTGGSGSLWNRLRDSGNISPDEKRKILVKAQTFPQSIGKGFSIFTKKIQNLLPIPNNQSEPRDHTYPSDKSLDFDYLQAKKLEPKAIFKVAGWVLRGDKGYRQDRETALTMMEYAVHIDKDVNNAWSYVKTCLEARQDLFNAKRDDYLDRAFSAVNVLWTDVETRLKRGTNEWKSADAYYETNRVKKIIDIHQKLVDETHRGNTLQNFADRLARWFHVTDRHEWQQSARQLYESAIIAEGDVFAMIKLALLIITEKEEDLNLALGLYRRAKNECDRKKHDNCIEGNHFDFTNYSMRFVSFNDVHKYLSYENEQGHRGVQLLLLHLQQAGSESEKAYATTELARMERFPASSRTSKTYSEDVEKIESTDSVASNHVAIDLL
ncbi:hypothetical protein BWQ96_08405 [Gracilariopsis chorda]|uniref:Uncharacterized protein n=1 Tax=Gracilariopsis chorda TaxID=448386 RepID=A0A2V3IL62_9FLOR|nr:hypothetical protein BWQ96_08405 [Gracilariopsis chorda]|eukprot:PXF41870.1 hypothetical protein BWQ96_08405 [Gracilariopsis chorda]